jgi:hypothetical protein
MTLPRIQPHESGRFLVTETGEPFFWLGDTAWELFHRLTLAEAETYLETRRRQGFNVIQAVVLAELDGLHMPNANGHHPLLGDDPTRPNEFYFMHVDAVIRLAAEKGLYIGLLPTWGDKVDHRHGGVGPIIFDADNARSYGAYVGQRYRHDGNVLWILGGDRDAAGYEDIWTAMAEGIAAGLGRRPFCTYHPRGGLSSSAALHNADWLDMNMMQSGHCLVDAPNWAMIEADYARTPTKPVIDAEPNYEDHPVDPYLRPWRLEYGRYNDYDVRKQAYRAVFAGACGHTYGNHSVWQMWSRDRQPITFAMPPWDEAILRPGATQMIHLKQLMLERSYLTRVPAQEILPDVEPISAEVGDIEEFRIIPARAAYPVATRCREGSYALIYFPLAEQTLRIDARSLRTPLNAWWFDPRNGKRHPAGKHPADLLTFTSPIAGPDWVLILEATGNQ